MHHPEFWEWLGAGGALCPQAPRLSLPGDPPSSASGVRGVTGWEEPEAAPKSKAHSGAPRSKADRLLGAGNSWGLGILARCMGGLMTKSKQIIFP